MQGLPTDLEMTLQAELRTCIAQQGDFHLLRSAHEDRDRDTHTPGALEWGSDEDDEIDALEAREALARQI